MGFYDEDNDVQTERQLVGYCSYDKSDIYEDDDYIRDKNGRLYLRENYIQACLGTNGEIIDPSEEE